MCLFYYRERIRDQDWHVMIFEIQSLKGTISPDWEIVGDTLMIYRMETRKKLIWETLSLLSIIE